MKNKSLLIGTASAMLAAAAFVFIPGEGEHEATYVPRTVADRATTAHDAGEYMALLRANVETGNVEPSDFIKARKQVNGMAQRKGGLGLNWIEMGPDNSGGRTRTICINESSFNEIWTGSVSGGLFRTWDGGNTWHRVESFNDNNAVSQIEIAGNGYIYVGTGNSHDSPSSQEGSGSAGFGVYVSTDDGATWTSISSMAPGAVGVGPDWSEVNSIVADPLDADKIYVGGNAGAFTYTTAGAPSADQGTLTPIEKSTGSTNWNQVDDIQVSSTGVNVIIAEGSKTWVSNTSGAQGSFTDVSGAGANEIPSGGVGRIEYAFAPSDDSWVYAAIAGSNGAMRGVYHSRDGGNTWDEINPGGVPSADPFSSFDGTYSQGRYDNGITVVPWDKTQIIVGGIRLFAWKQAQSSPSFGQWEQIAFQGATCLGCVHADIHEFAWNPNGILYVGTDGGVYQSQDINNMFHYSSNRGFNTAQFYGISHNAYGHVFGGTQDNGMFLMNQQGNTYMEAVFSSSGIGDGFTTEMSHYFPDVMFGTSQFGWLDRSDDGGVSFAPFYNGPITAAGSPGESLGPFRTQVRMYETLNDPNSPDSLIVPVGVDYAPGDTIWYFSSTQQSELYEIATAQVDSGDTLMLPDPVQTIMAVGFSANQGVWVTRDAFRFNVNPVWYQIMDGSSAAGTFSGEAVNTMEFAKDGLALYVGTYSGSVYRVTGWDSAYDANTLDIAGTAYALDVARIRPSGGGVVTGICVDPNDPDHVVVCTGGFGGQHVFETNNATGTAHGTNAFSQIHGDLPNIPAYSVVIDKANPNIIVVGTEYGIYATDNGGTSWFDQGFERVPVFDMRQQWHDWGDGPTTNAGVIYVGTHGRGAWRTDDLTSIRPFKPVASNDDEYDTNINIFPNPVVDQAQMNFELADNSDVQINIYDMNGRLVQTTEMDAVAGQNTVQLNTSELSSGTYFVSLESATQRDVAKIIVK